MSERPSWFTCSFCHEPHTQDNPLIPHGIKGVKGAEWQLHAGCVAGQQADLIPGAVLVAKGLVA